MLKLTLIGKVRLKNEHSTSEIEGTVSKIWE